MRKRGCCFCSAACIFSLVHGKKAHSAKAVMLVGNDHALVRLRGWLKWSRFNRYLSKPQPGVARCHSFEALHTCRMIRTANVV